MKKFPMLLAGALLGGFGIANAQTIAPTSGSILGTLPEEITVTWDENISLNPEADAYDSQFNVLNISIYVNGVMLEYEEGGKAPVQGQEGPIYAEGNASGSVLTISTGMVSDYISTLTNNEPYSVQFLVPYEGVLIGDEGVVNDLIEINYYIGYTELPEPTIDPSDEKPLSGYVSNIAITWGGLPVTVNSDVEVTVTPKGGEAQVVAVEASDYAYMDPETYLSSPGITIMWQEVIMKNYLVVGGEYSVNIPEGLISVGEWENDAIDLNYTIYATELPDEEAITPAPGFENFVNPSALNEVTIPFNSPITLADSKEGIECELQSNDDSGEPLALLADDQTVIDGYLNPELVTINEDSIVLDLSGLTEGKWIVTIPAGYVKMNEYTSNQKVELLYNVWGGMASAIVLQPEEYSTMAIPAPVNLTWNYVTVYPSESGLTAKLNGETVSADLFSFATMEAPGEGEGGPDNSPGDVPVPAAEGSGNVLSINVVELLEDYSGQVTLYIPAGIVENEDGLANPEQTIYFTIKPAYPVNPDFTYDDEDEVLVLTYPLLSEAGETLEEGYALVSYNYEAVSTIEGDDDFNVELTYQNWDNEEGQISGNSEYSWEVTALYFNFSDIEFEDGNYTLVIPEGAMTVADNYINTGIAYAFHFEDGVFGEGHLENENPGTEIPGGEGEGEGDSSAVSSLETENGEAAIYNLQGVKVANPNNGIYIINGKKVLIRK